jgi:hypothetical protein
MLFRWLLTKKQKITSASEDAEKKKLLYTTGGNVNEYSNYGEQYGDFFKKYINKSAI